MIPANKSRLFDWILDRYNRWLFRRRFQNVHIKGLDNLSSTAAPAILCANHSSWWDGLLAHMITREAGLDGYCMMEEKQLRGLRPFTWAGAFSVVREKPREAIESVRYAAKLLRSNSNCGLWIFPQGQILPNDTRPLNFYRGLEKILSDAPQAGVVPVAMRFEFRGSYKPEIFVAIGSKLDIMDCPRLSDAAASEVARLLESIKTDIVSGQMEEYRALLR